jgi:hypothetical protein
MIQSSDRTILKLRVKNKIINIFLKKKIELNDRFYRASSAVI